ncbi:hypothetical protein Aduo_012488 [Ancylostoma duodenale]
MTPAQDDLEEQVLDETEFHRQKYVTHVKLYFQLVITAWSVFDLSRNASRALRIEVEDVDDNAPQFAQGALPVFAVPHSSGRADITVGKVSAEDKDGDELSAIHYYLLPTCTAEFDNFSVNDYSGEIAVSGGTATTHPPHRVDLCLLASNYADLNVSQVAFDAKNASMIRTAVVFEAEAPMLHPAPAVENNTVTVIQENLRDTPVPVTHSSSVRDVRYSLDHVDFKPAQDSTGVLHSSTNALFFVEPTSGDIRVNPAISEQPQGVYNVFVNTLSATSKEILQRFVKKYHYVKDEMKMRYVFNETLEEFTRTHKEFGRKVQAALEKDHPEDNWEVFLSQPRENKRNSMWTSVCFHATMNGQVQGERALMSALSQSTVESSELSKLYHLHKIINIERCDATAAPVRQSALVLPTQVLMLVAGVAILILILIALLTYICFVRRYKEHLRAKQKQMKGSPLLSGFLDHWFL